MGDACPAADIAQFCANLELAGLEVRGNVDPGCGSDTAPEADIALVIGGGKISHQSVRTVAVWTDKQQMAEHGSETGYLSASQPLFLDDGAQRLRYVIERLLDTSAPISSSDHQDAAQIWIADRVAAQHFGMAIGFQRLPLLNARYDRGKVDAMLEAMRAQIIGFAKDCSRHDMVIVRHATGFYLLAEALRDRSKWNWMAEEIAAMLHQSEILDGAHLSAGAQIALASRKPEEDPAHFIARLDAGIAELGDDVSMLVKWVDRGSDLPPPREAKLENDLALALEDDAIIVRFQPQFDIKSGHLTGAEALARWQHPDLGELGAATLFTVAERASMVQPVSDYIQRKALDFAAIWPAALSDLRLSINLTPQDMAVPGFAAAMVETVKASGFDPARLTVEITETALIRDLKRASRLCALLREADMRVAIDDFGTGFSSLLYLKSLPVDYLKIDGAISRDIEGSARDQIIVRSIIALGLAIDLEIIAEGVETEAQRRHLADEGCHYYQGFLGGEAMDNDDFVKFAMRAN